MKKRVRLGGPGRGDRKERALGGGPPPFIQSSTAQSNDPDNPEQCYNEHSINYYGTPTRRSAVADFTEESFSLQQSLSGVVI